MVVIPPKVIHARAEPFGESLDGGASAGVVTAFKYDKDHEVFKFHPRLQFYQVNLYLFMLPLIVRGRKLCASMNMKSLMRGRNRKQNSITGKFRGRSKATTSIESC